MGFGVVPILDGGCSAGTLNLSFANDVSEDPSAPAVFPCCLYFTVLEQMHSSVFLALLGLSLTVINGNVSQGRV